MKNTNWCPVCGDFKYTDLHKCPPTWNTYILGYDEEDEWVKVHGRTPEQAAIKRAEKFDVDNDYHLTEGNKIVICVQNTEDTILKFECYGVPMTDFRATKIS